MSANIPLLGKLLILAVAAFLATSALGYTWARDMNGTAVHVLGTGNRLALLVTAGTARVLIVDGNDSAAFANALASAQKPGFARIDVMVITGPSGAFAVAAKALSIVDANRTLALEPLASDPRLADTAMPIGGDGQLLRIGDEMEIRIETSTIAGESDGAWRVLITSEGSHVALLSDTAAVAEFTWQQHISALIVQRGSLEKLPNWLAPSAVVGSSMLINGDELDNWFEQSPANRYLLRVFAGESQELRFGANGLELPDTVLTS